LRGIINDENETFAERREQKKAGIFSKILSNLACDGPGDGLPVTCQAG
jgi:hypothetical protein